MTDLEPINWLLSIQVTRNCEAQTITLSQWSYIKFLKDQCPTTADNITSMCHVPYWEAIRSLMYTSVGTCPISPSPSLPCLNSLTTPGTLIGKLSNMFFSTYLARRIYTYIWRRETWVGGIHRWWWCLTGTQPFLGVLIDAPLIPARFRSFLGIPVPFQWNLAAKISKYWYSSTYTRTVPRMDENGMALECMTGMDAKNCQIWQVLHINQDKSE